MNEKILFVDDEKNILDGYRRNLRGTFNIETVESGYAALELISTQGPYAVVVSDMRMPEMDGVELLTNVEKQTPDTIRIMLTGNADQKTATDALNKGHIFQFLNKPCSKEKLIDVIDAAIIQYRQSKKNKERLDKALTGVDDLTQKLAYHSSHDQLTNLINRNEFEHKIQMIFEKIRAQKDEHTLCHIDIDQIKVVNDGCGHIAGDELIRQLTSIIRGFLRKRDTLARIGGDEFGLFLEYCPLNQGEQVAEAIREKIEQYSFQWDNKQFHITVSIGLVHITELSESVSQILSCADSACSLAKEMGRNRVHVYQLEDAVIAQHHGDMLWVPRINQALNEDRFELYAQPIVPIQGDFDEGDHYELLIRLKGEDGKIVPPGMFLPAAEKYNLATKLDCWVISSAFNWLKNHPVQLNNLHMCSINLSGITLGDNTFVDFVEEQFNKTKIPPQKICFEITETAAISNLSNANKCIEKLKSLGCPFALDDFGSGLSSFAYLRQLPVEFLKIDGMFIKEIDKNEFDLAMVKSMRDIAQVVGMKTIAEFVENDDILNVLKDIGIDHAQGYGIGKPVPLNEYVELAKVS